MKKETEIKALQTLKEISADKSSYLSDLFTPEMIEQMIWNIQNDLEISNGTNLAGPDQVLYFHEEIEKAKTRGEQEVERVKSKVILFNQRLDEILEDLIMREQFEIAYKNFDSAKVMKAKLRYNPSHLTQDEIDRFCESIV